MEIKPTFVLSKKTPLVIFCLFVFVLLLKNQKIVQSGSDSSEREGNKKKEQSLASPCVIDFLEELLLSELEFFFLL